MVAQIDHLLRAKRVALLLGCAPCEKKDCDGCATRKALDILASALKPQEASAQGSDLHKYTGEFA